MTQLSGASPRAQAATAIMSVRSERRNGRLPGVSDVMTRAAPRRRGSRERTAKGEGWPPSFRDGQGRIPRPVEPPLVPPQQVVQGVVLGMSLQPECSPDRLAAEFLRQAADEARTE